MFSPYLSKGRSGRQKVVLENGTVLRVVLLLHPCKGQYKSLVVLALSDWQINITQLFLSLCSVSQRIWMLFCEDVKDSNLSWGFLKRPQTGWNQPSISGWAFWRQTNDDYHDCSVCGGVANHVYPIQVAKLGQAYDVIISNLKSGLSGTFLQK